jgi:hypothetical protein
MEEETYINDIIEEVNKENDKSQIFATNENYVKQSFDKLIYIYNNSEYQKYYLDEIDKINNKFDKDNINKNNLGDIKKNTKQKNKKKIRKNESDEISNFDINKYFCESNCIRKFKEILEKFNENIFDKNSKIFEIIRLVSEIKHDDEKLNKLINYIKNEI